MKLCKQFEYLGLDQAGVEEDESESEGDESDVAERASGFEEELYNIKDPFQFIDNIIDTIRDEVNTMEINNTANEPNLSEDTENENLSSESSESSSESGEDDILEDEASINPEEHQSKTQFEIQIGTDKLPRFSCANHKLNLAIRGAIGCNQTITSDLKKLNQYVNKVRRSHNMNRIFQNYRCRLRFENQTRWGSAFLCLETIKKAYDRGIFNDPNLELTLPIDITNVESYIKLLKPAYLMNIGFQSHTGSIADVVPNILNLLNVLKHLKKTTTHLDLCVLLINKIKKRFN